MNIKKINKKVFFFFLNLCIFNKKYSGKYYISKKDALRTEILIMDEDLLIFS